MEFYFPWTTIFFNHSPKKLIVACSDGIFIVDVGTQSTKSLRRTPQDVFYYQNALALSEDDAVLVAGTYLSSYSVFGYDIASRTRLWILNTVSAVGAVCMLGDNVLVTVHGNPTLVLDRNSGTQVADMKNEDKEHVYGLGVIEGFFVLP